ncbi:MAG: hypothetical protein H8D94_01570 [Candidatus Pelagibacter sp.]|nr:hypothetical protein [Candidatus Pelagibacter sp.]
MNKYLIILFTLIIGCNPTSENTTLQVENLNSNISVQEELAELGFGNSSGNSIEIILNTPIETAGFQFELVTTNGFILTNATGGMAEDAEFTTSSSELGVVLGFSFSGATIPAGNYVLTNLSFTGDGQSEFCLVNPVIDGLDVQLGECVVVVTDPDAIITIGNNTLSTMDILIESEVEVAGFQFDINGITVSEAFGGIAEESGFTMTVGNTTIIGFSFDGSVMPVSTGVMVTLAFEGEQGAEVCLSDLVLSSPVGTAIVTEVGDCITLDLIEPGDVNFDGVINVVDIVLVVNYILDELVPNYEETLAADFNQDGLINVVDVVNMVSVVLDTSIPEAVEWIEENFPRLKIRETLEKLNYIQHLIHHIEQEVN